jgi:ribosomal protein L11 methyltransferase
MTSNPKYLKLTLKIEPLLPGREIALAWLDTCGFDMFENKAEGLIAYGKESDINRDACNEILLDLAGIAKVSSDLEVVESENWNATWEADYPAIDVDGLACMRAPFHSKPQSGLDVVIQPQMSFGTGHHATTWQMLRRLLDESVSGKSILDMGCGTGVLAIASHLLGADEVVAIDIDSWSFENTRANYELNGLDAVSAPGQVLLGDSRLLAPWLERFDLLLANINRNVLLEDMPRFDHVLKESGRVLMSGFFHSDLDQLKEQASKMKWNFISSTEREGWCCALWEKSSL